MRPLTHLVNGPAAIRRAANPETKPSRDREGAIPSIHPIPPRTITIVLLAAAFATFTYAADAPTFSKDIAPILRERCAGCHASKVHMGGLSIDTYSSLMKGGSTGPDIVPGHSADSRLYLLITAKIMPAMPMDGTKLPDASVEAIRAWIDAGANAPPPGEETVLTSAPASLPHINPEHPVPRRIFDLAWSPDGKLLAVAGFREVRLVDPSTRQTLATLQGGASVIRDVVFSRDGRLLAASGGLPARQGEVQIWDVASHNRLLTFTGHSDVIYGLAFSPDGKTLATSSYDKLIKLWDDSTGKEIRTLKDHIDAVYALAFTSDGKRLVSGAADRTVKIWDVATGERLYTLSEPQDGINTLALDPTGPRVVAAGLDKTIRVWQLGPNSGALLASLIAHEDSILRLAWSPDCKTILSSSADGTIKVLDSRDLTELASFTKQPDWVDGLQFSPDGRRFAAGRIDGSWTIYNLPPAAGTVRAAR